MKQQINLNTSDVFSAVEQYVMSKFPEFAEKDVRVKMYVDEWNRVVAIATVEDPPANDGKTEEV